MIRCKTNGADGVYFTYTEEKPISFNPFYTDDYEMCIRDRYGIKLVHVLPLVKEYLAVGVVDDALLDHGRGNDVVHLLRHHDCLAVKMCIRDRAIR